MILFVLIILLLVPTQVYSKNILVINSNAPKNEIETVLDDGLLSCLSKNEKDKIMIVYITNNDLFVKFKPDIIVAFGDKALMFVLTHYNKNDYNIYYGNILLPKEYYLNNFSFSIKQKLPLLTTMSYDKPIAILYNDNDFQSSYLMKKLEKEVPNCKSYNITESCELINFLIFADNNLIIYNLLNYIDESITNLRLNRSQIDTIIHKYHKRSINNVIDYYKLGYEIGEKIINDK